MDNVKNIDFSFVKFEGGFWKYRYELNKNVSLKSVYEQFEKTGRFDALRFNFKDGGIKPHFFFDSDAAKWIEAVAYLIISEGGYNKEQEFIDELVCSMAKNQLPNGYLNSYFIQFEPDNIFQVRDMHELYCAGHLVEAAIAYDKATGKHDFLNIMIKYLDYIEKAFIIEKTTKFSTPGHEEIELALIKLYEYTNNKKYLEMAKFFINTRGAVQEPWNIKGLNLKYLQSEIPVRELTLAEGHAVRAVYLYIAMAELAKNENDAELFAACKRLYKDIVSNKMYVTGGIGSTHLGESFTVAYDLPNLTAYNESCAAIGLILFALSMQKYEFSAEYSHLIERIMYNGLLSSTSIDGKAFFYENPLEIHIDSIDKETCLEPSERPHLPIVERLEVFGCSCCPPNINRMFARLGDLFFSVKDNNLIINQFGTLSLNNDNASLQMSTNYPNDGKIKIDIQKCSYSKLYIRIPEWCDNFSVSTNYVVEKGYIVVNGTLNTIEIDFNMQPYFLESNPNIRNNAGRVALCYGPIVYCLEKIDNNYPLNALSVDVNKKISIEKISDYNMNSLVAFGRIDQIFTGLYRKIQNNSKEVNLYFRPYWTFANRGKSDMLVWVRKK